jgi:hypothetical protein
MPSAHRNVETRQIPLSRGLSALVDAADYAWLSQWKWNAHASGRRHHYAARSVQRDGKRQHVYMHRLLTGESGEVDHINGNKLDNRRANLRVVSHPENTRNQRTKRLGCTTEHIGVYREADGRWRAQITRDYRTKNLGTYASLEQAVAARARGVELHFGGSHALGA